MRRRLDRRSWFGGTALLVASAVVGSGLLSVPPAVAAGVSLSKPPPVTSSPDMASARLAAQAQRSEVLVDGLTSETSRTWAEPDGSTKMEMDSGPARVRRGGQWLDVDSSLNVSGSRLVPNVVTQNYSFSAGGTGSLVSWTDASGHAMSVSFPGVLPAPQINGNVASYIDALPGVDVLLTGLTSGFDVALRFTRRPAVGFTQLLRWSLTGMAVKARSQGFDLADATSGATVLTSPTATMSDAVPEDPLHGKMPHSATMAVSANATGMVLTPDAAFLTDPSTVYPVVADPQFTNINDGADLYTSSQNSGTVYYNPSQFSIGNDGHGSYRSYLAFNNWTEVRGKTIQDAYLMLWETYSSTCATGTSSEEVDTDTMPSQWNDHTDWANQPQMGPRQGHSIFVHAGPNNACGPAAYDDVYNTTPLIANWANYTDSTGQIGLRAYDEFDAYGYKHFNTAHTGNGGIPTLYVTYNTPPGTDGGQSVAPCATCSSPALTSSRQPNLTGSTTDADNNTLRHDFEVWPSGGSSAIQSGSVSSVASGATATWTVPSALADGSYQYRVRAFDGIDYGPWSGWYTFTVDTTAPVAPTITAPWSSNAWAPSTSTSGTFSWSSDSTVNTYKYWLDNAAPTQVAATTTSASYTSVAQGWHTFTVQATDLAGNTSTTSYSFGIGDATLDAPNDQDRTQDSITVKGRPSDSTALPYLQYQYVVGTSTAWTAVPVADLQIPGSSTSPTATGMGTYPYSTYSAGLVWRAARTLSNATGMPDGLMSVRACFASSSTTSAGACSGGHRVQVDRTAFGASYATRQVGPGTLSLLTGDFSVTATDATLGTYGGSLSVTRTATTLSPPTNPSNSPQGALGPGWILSLPDPGAGRMNQTLTDDSSSGYVLLTGADGSDQVFQYDTGSGKYLPLGDANDGTRIVKGVDGQSNPLFTATDPDGTTTTWTVPAGSPSGTNVLAGTVQMPGVGSPTYGVSGGQVNYVIGQAPPNVTCSSTSSPNCRSLVFRYGTPSAGTSNLVAPIGTYDVAGRLAEIDAVVTDPATGTVVTTPISRYAYDSTNATTARLVAVWDPRVSPALVTSYAYVGATNQLASVKPAGLNAWQLAYDTHNRLRTVKRHDDTLNTDLTTTIAYGSSLYPDDPVKWGSSGTPGNDAPSVGLKDMSANVTSGWGESSDVVANAAAVFGPEWVPGTTPPGAADWPHADISYLDVNGREVNTASYGNGDWQVTATGYDKNGSVLTSLTAENRRQALSPTSSTDPYVAGLTDPAARAAALSMVNTYSSDGTELVDTVGPTHPVQLANGQTVDARSHTHNVYDENSPGGAVYRLVTTTTVAAQTADGVDHDARTTRTGYGAVVGGDGDGWTLRKPTSVSTVRGDGTLSTHLTRFDSSGRVVETRLPAGTADSTGAGNDAHSTSTSYYAATGTGSCVSAL